MSLAAHSPKSNKKAELPHFLRQLGYLSLKRPAAFRPLLTEGFALSDEYNITKSEECVKGKK